MKNKKLLLLFLLTLSLTSCNNNNKFVKINLNENYEIKETNILKEQKVAQAGLAFSTAALNEFTYSTDWHWSYDFSPLFFTDDCLFTIDELKSFAIDYKLNYSFQEEKYKCLGTNYFSYNEKIYKKESTFTYKSSTSEDSAGIYAPFLISDLVEYTITPKDGRNSFKLYSSYNNYIYVDVLKIRN